MSHIQEHGTGGDFMKIKYCIFTIFIAIVVVTTLGFYRKNYINCHLLDSMEISQEKNIEGAIICDKTNKNYSTYNLSQYDVNFDTNSILITIYEIKTIKRKGDFVRIWVKNKTENKLNIYLLNKPNICFDEKYPLSFNIVK